ncbi:MAG: COX15/CtaA family protein [Woeseiaceae bacterium]
MNNDISKNDQNKAIARWLFICCGLVFAMVVLGGVTRLTGSGLSMAEWRPIMGILPPLSDAEWQRVFDIYRQTPEFLHVNFDMDVEGFKGIFWLEYLHRVLGRLLGFAFSIPLVYFVVRKYISMRDLPWYVLMLALGGAQGFIGKIMVASGQVDAPHVSQYRLVAHLTAAFLVYAMMFWRALSLRQGDIKTTSHHWFSRTAWLTALISLTVVSGGFVAGLKAGWIFNTFPKMGDTWLPPGFAALDPFWRNLTENMATVQFNHRLLAIGTFVVIVIYWLRARRANLPRHAEKASTALLHTGTLQVLLGISTLLLSVPTFLAVSHQAVALVLLTVALFLTHSLRKVPM